MFNIIFKFLNYIRPCGPHVALTAFSGARESIQKKIFKSEISSTWCWS